MNIYAKLLKIQTTLKANKSKFSSFGNYSYRSCEDILEALKPHLAELNAIILLDDTVEEISGRHYIKSTARLVDCDKGETVEATAYAREPLEKPKMSPEQATGSASSYARKYALQGLLALDDNKDADSLRDIEGRAKKSEATKKVAFTKNKELIELFEAQDNEKKKKILEWAGVDNIASAQDGIKEKIYKKLKGEGK